MIGNYYIIRRNLILIQQIKEVRRDHTGDWICDRSEPFDANCKIRKKVNMVGYCRVGLLQKDDLDRPVCPNRDVTDESLRRLKSQRRGKCLICIEEDLSYSVRAGLRKHVRELPSWRRDVRPRTPIIIENAEAAENSSRTESFHYQRSPLKIQIVTRQL